MKSFELPVNDRVTIFGASVRRYTHNPLSIPELIWENRELLINLTLRELRLRYTGSLLGLAWMFVIPLVQLSIYTFVFGFIYKVASGESGVIGYAASLFSGFVPFILISESVNAAPSRIVAQPNFVKKVVFPLEILPLVSTGVAAIHSLGAMAILLVVAGFLVNGISWPVLWVVPLMLILIMIACGISWLLSSLGVFFRDLSTSTQLVVQFLFFLTPITYPLSLVPKQILPVYKLNPLVGIVEGIRGAVLYGYNPDIGNIAYPLVFAVASMVVGFYCFQQCRRAFADVI